MLTRLDKLAQDDRTEGSLAARMAGNWPEVIDALRSGGTAAVPALLDAKADKADTPPSPPDYDPSEDCWRRDDGVWMTCFPPPPGFEGQENRPWDGFNYYERACTPEEAALLDAHDAAAEAEERAEITADSEARRDLWFASLREALRPPASSET